MAISSSLIARRLYRDLLRGAKRVGGEDGAQRANQTRDWFKANKMLTEPAKVEAFLSKAKSRLEFLEILSPKTFSEKGTRPGTYIVQNGRVINGAAESIPQHGAMKDRRVDPAMLQRHEQLVRRQHFMDRR
jgi:hypothetical protein